MTTAPMGARQEAPSLPRYDLKTVLRLLPRLRCARCRQPLTLIESSIYCWHCSREYGEVVEQPPVTPTPEQFAALPKQRAGRPKKEPACPESACLRPGPDGGLCGSCNVRQWRQKQKAAT